MSKVGDRTESNRNDENICEIIEQCHDEHLKGKGGLGRGRR